MRKNIKIIFVIICISFVFLISGIFIGRYFLGKGTYDKSNDDTINTDTDNSVGVDKNNKTVQFALGKYLYYLAFAVHKNCDSTYLDIEISEDDGVILNNYYELKNSFTDDFVNNNNWSFFNIANNKNNCYFMMENGKINANNCWCGSGNPLNTEYVLTSFKISSAIDNEISYSITIKQFDNNLNEYTNTFNDSFTIKKIDDNWKIDKYTYRYISYEL